MSERSSLYYDSIVRFGIVSIAVAIVLYGVLFFFGGIETNRYSERMVGEYLDREEDYLRGLVEYERDIIDYYMNDADQRHYIYLEKKMDEIRPGIQTLLLSAPSQEEEELRQHMRQNINALHMDADLMMRVMNLDGYVFVNTEFATDNKTELKNIVDASGKMVIFSELEEMSRKDHATMRSLWKKNGEEGRKYTILSKIPGSRLYIAISVMHDDQTEEERRRIFDRLSQGKQDIIVFDYNGTIHAHHDQDIIGTNQSDLADGEDRYIIQELMQAREMKSGVSALFSTGDSSAQKNANELYYADCHDEWELCIAASQVLDEHERVKESSGLQVLKRIRLRNRFIMILVLTIFGGSAFYFGRILYMLQHQMQDCISAVRKALENDNTIDNSLFSFPELYRLNKIANKIIGEMKEEKAKLVKLSFHDNLTGIYNRNKFEEEFKRERAYFHRYKNPVSLLLFDIDTYKEINDTYGHPKGDEILVAMTALVQECMRSVDLFFRWGGDEFLVILPRITRYQARLFAEKIRVSVENHDFLIEEQVTISIGVTSLQMDDNEFSIVARADRALYEAKREGRNKTVIV